MATYIKMVTDENETSNKRLSWLVFRQSSYPMFAATMLANLQRLELLCPIDSFDHIGKDVRNVSTSKLPFVLCQSVKCLSCANGFIGTTRGDLYGVCLIQKGAKCRRNVNSTQGNAQFKAELEVPNGCKWEGPNALA